MAIYFILLFFILIFPCRRGNLYEDIDKTSRKIGLVKMSQIYIVFVLLLLIFMAGLRSYTVGIDLRYHYLSNFQKYAAQPWSNISDYGIECGLFVLSKLISIVSNQGQLFIFVTSLISFTLTIRFFYINSEDFKFSVAIFITYCMMYQYLNQIAQCIAVSIILFGYDYLKKDKSVVFLIYVAIATTFHTTSIFCVLFLLIRRIKVTRKSMMRFSVITVAFAVAYNVFFELGAKLLPQYEWYRSSVRHGVGDIGLGVIIRIVMLGSVVIFSMYLAKFKNRMEEFENVDFMIHMTYIAFLFQMITTRMIVMNRMGFYVLPFVCLLLPACVDGLGKNRTILRHLILAGLILYFIYITVQWGSASYGVVPHTFYWN